MARKAMVTRTVLATKCKYISMNPETLTSEEKHITLSGSYKNATDALKKIKSLVNPEIELAVKMLDMEEDNKLYGMYEEDFIANAMELDEKRMPITAETENE